jgi:hypothetical protein
VLLSDGYDNKGCDQSNPGKPSALDAAAALPADLPIYSCAMGPASDQNLLGQLANESNGRYYFMPTIDDLFEIYNYIRGQVTGDGIIVNESSMASTSQVSGWVDGCAQSVLFTVAWHEPSLKYVPREPKGPHQIAVRLRSPGGRWLPRSATEFVCTIGDGYVSFAIQEPQPGLWTVEVSTSRARHTPYTVGGFVRSTVGLRIDVPVFVAQGEPLDIRARVINGRKPIDGVKMLAQVSALPTSNDDYFRKFEKQLKEIKIPDALNADGQPDKIRLQTARLVLLRDQIRSKTGEDILARTIHHVAMGGATLKPRVQSSTEEILPGGTGKFDPATATPATVGANIRTSYVQNGTVFDPRQVQRPRQSGLVSGRFTRTKIPGSYTVKVMATGFSPECNSRFVRHDLVSVIVGSNPKSHLR